MPINITMPALSPTMEEGTLAKWNIKPGDTVEAGMVIAEIETDKATMEVESIDDGVVAQILVEAGTEGVKVNELIAVLAEEGEDPSAIKADASPASNGNAAPAEAAPKAEPAKDVATEVSNQVASTPIDLPSAGKGDDRIKASPLARRIAALKGIDLSALKDKGSGPRGRIVKKDVENYQPGTSMVPASKGASAPPPGGLILPTELDDRIYDPDGYDLVPLTGMQKTVAKRLTESFMQIPHFPLTVEIQLDKLLSARKGINEAAPEGVKVSVNDMLIKASAMALMTVPECNASYTDKGFAYHKSANVSVAVAIDGGLITPIVRNAQLKGLAEIAAEMKDLAARAREKKLAPQEYMGGTFSISNLGMFGIKNFSSIINPPEGMIMSVGAGAKQPVVKDDGTLGVATVMTVTLTCDHRVIGGAEGAKWINVFKQYVEMPESMLL